MNAPTNFVREENSMRRWQTHRGEPTKPFWALATREYATKAAICSRNRAEKVQLSRARAQELLNRPNAVRYRER